VSRRDPSVTERDLGLDSGAGPLTTPPQGMGEDRGVGSAESVRSQGWTVESQPVAFRLVIVSRQRSVRTLTERPPPGRRSHLAAWLGRRVEHSVGGVQVHADNVQRYFESAGHAVEFVTPFDGTWLWPFLAAGVRKSLFMVRPSLAERWRRAWHRVLLRSAFRRAIRDLAATREPLVVYTQCVLTADVAIREREDAPVLMASHSNGSEADEAWRRGECAQQDRFYMEITQLEQRVLPALDGLVFPSEAAAGAATSRVPAAADVPRMIVPNFLADDWAEFPGSIDQVRRDLVSIGRLDVEKNHRFLLEVLAQANRRDQRYTLTVIGEGPQRAALEEMCRRLDLHDQVRFLGERDDVAQLLNVHTAYIHSSDLPVLAAPVGGIPEILRDGLEGRFLPLDSPADAAKILIDVLGDPDEVARMGAAGRARFHEHFSSSVIGPRFAEFFRVVLSAVA
jgi:glycosyltransferase involved in cell wall biosynthesis